MMSDTWEITDLPYTSDTWEIDTDAGWKSFDPEIDAVLKRASLDGVPTVRVTRDGWTYEVDLCLMRQVFCLGACTVTAVVMCTAEDRH